MGIVTHKKYHTVAGRPHYERTDFSLSSNVLFGARMVVLEDRIVSHSFIQQHRSGQLSRQHVSYTHISIPVYWELPVSAPSTSLPSILVRKKSVLFDARFLGCPFPHRAISTIIPISCNVVSFVPSQ
ncbi:hypothetical protein QCA50_020305 [Cerrena zonata]|uniref:Uncharacterized protein n=1 Tax=Cerrena zonata TaxID=2478898 RepID=A0AAW0FDG3_9APHY